MTEPVPDAVGQATAAGIYDAVLGGGHNTAADRAATEQIMAIEPELRQVAWANRGFLQRAASWIAEQGVRGFLDVGAGLPTMRNTHDVVRDTHPDARVVYVDNDPGVVAKARQLLDGTDNVAYVGYDLTDAALLDDPAIAEIIAAGDPVGLLLVGVLYFVPDAADPVGCVRRLVDALPPGSYVAISHVISDRHDDGMITGTASIYQHQSAARLFVRSTQQVARFVDGLAIVPPYPGTAARLDYIGLWGAEDPAAAADDASRWFVAAVAQGPST